VQSRHAAELRYIQDAELFSSNMLRLADSPITDAKKPHSIAADFPFMKAVFPTRMMMPLQDALTGALPSASASHTELRTHNPFPVEPVTISGLEDAVVIMSSLQKPKKLVFLGSDGSKHPFLCKPHDDLRKDARLMDFNSMINKLLKSASESRRRQLCEWGDVVDGVGKGEGDGESGELIHRYPNLRRHAAQ
jgi:serine/threonine-protein kinase ATR